MFFSRLYTTCSLQESSVTVETFETTLSPLNEIGMVNGEEEKTSGKSGEMSLAFSEKASRRVYMQRR